MGKERLGMLGNFYSDCKTMSFHFRDRRRKGDWGEREKYKNLSQSNHPRLSLDDTALLQCVQEKTFLPSTGHFASFSLK